MKPQSYLLGVVSLGLGRVLAQSQPPGITSPPLAPTTTTSECPRTICIHGINECDIPYGGCFLDPACGGTIPDFTRHACTTCSRTCVHYTNECGMVWGGCFRDPGCVGALPMSVTKPPCPKEKRNYAYTTCSRSICVDDVNECGEMYGGCFLDPVCTGGTEWPTFTKPPCNYTTTTEPTTTSASATCKGTICADYINECGEMYGGCFLDPVCTGGTAWPTFSKPPCSSAKCSQSICYDAIDECGQFYGGCTLAPECGGPKTPTFWKPPCPPTTVPTYTTTAPPTCTLSICVDGIDACGQGWGGCFLAPECGGKEPSWTKPPCSKTIVPPTAIKYTTIIPPGQAVTKFVTRILTYPDTPVKSYYANPTRRARM